MSKVADTYYLDKTYNYHNAVIRVYRPILTEEERTRRMEVIKDAARRLLMSLEREQYGENSLI